MGTQENKVGATMKITLPLESEIILYKDGTSTTEHKTFVTGEVGQALAEAFVMLKGGTVADLVKLAERNRKAAAG